MSTMKTSTAISLILFITLGLTVTGEHVYLRFHQQPEKISCDLPAELHASLENNDKHFYDLILLRNYDIDINLPLFVTSKDSNSGWKFTHQALQADQNIAVYQDLENGAAVLIQCINEVSETDGHFRLDGHLHLEGKHYRVEPYLTNGRIVRHPHHVDKHAYKISIQEENHACPLHGEQDEDFTISRQTKLPKETLPSFESLNRHKRAVDNGPFTIDIAVHVDKTAYETWLERASGDVNKAQSDIRRYFTHVMNVVNLRYQTLKPEIDITIRPFKVVIHKEETPFIDELKETINDEIQVNAEAVLGNLTEWIRNNSEEIGEYDHILLFTGYNLYSNGNEQYTTGLATIGTMCNTDGTSISVVEDKGGFQSIYISAHELGHGFNSKHDQEDNNCIATARYIMAPRSYDETAENALNPWSFSSCSKNYINRYIEDHLNETSFKSCVTEKLNTSNIPDITKEPAGQVYGPDEQCRHFIGPESYVCRESVFGNETDVCRKMFCYIPGSSKCRSILPAFGTSCGNKKWCENGVCVANEAAPSREASCIFGDYDGIMNSDEIMNSEGITCATIRSEKNMYCYQEIVAQRCCETCAKVKTNNSVCLYGDKVSGCKEGNCGGIITGSNGTLYDIGCCQTCNYSGSKTETSTQPPATTTSPSQTTSSSCADVPSVNNKTCPQLLDDHGAKQCYNKQIEEACCKSCSQRQRNIPNCKYGDKDDEECSSSMCNTKPSQYSETCCESCHSVESETTKKSVTTQATQTTTQTTDKTQATQTTTQTTDKTTTQRCSDTSFENMMCLDYIQQHGKSKCYSSDVKNSCCPTCELYEKPSNPGCEFGDREASCSQKDFTKIQSCDVQTAEQCCESCANLQPTPAPDCKDNEAGIENLSCTNYINKNGKSSCYNSQVKEKCCNTCHKLGNHTLIGCEYGDLHESVCQKIDVSSYTSCGEITRKYCCYQCLIIESGNTGKASKVISSVALHVFLCVLTTYLI